MLVALLMLGILAGELPARGAFPGTNGRIAFSSNESSRTGVDLLSIEADGSDRRALWVDCGDDFQVEWDAAGQKIVFVNAGFTYEGSFRTTMVVSDPTTGPRGLGPGHHPSWAPDGSRIAFSDARGLSVMNADGSNRQLIYDGRGSFVGISSIAWSPVGDRIAFVAADTAQYGDVFVIDPDGTGLTDVVTSPDLESDVDWSPDGRLIVFTRSVGSGLADLYLSDVAGGAGLTRLTDTPDISEMSPVFSPDGTRIAYTESAASGSSRSIVLIDGEGNKTDLPNTGGAFDLDWQPTPTLSPQPTPSVSASTTQTPQPTAPLTGGTSTAPAPGPPPCPTPSFAQCPPTSLTTCAPPREQSRTVSLEAARARIRFGREMTLKGAISSETSSCMSGQTVTIQRISPIPEQNLVTVQTNDDGTFSASISPDATASYIARVDAGACDHAESTPVSIRVRVAVRLRFRNAAPPFARVATSVRPCAGHAGTKIALQRRGKKGFRRVETATLDDDCRVRKAMRLGRGAYRARWSKQHNDHDAGVSRVVRIR